MLPIRIAYADERLIIESVGTGVSLLLKPFGQQFSLMLTLDDLQRIGSRLAAFAMLAAQSAFSRGSIVVLHGPFSLHERDGRYYLAVTKRDEHQVVLVLTTGEAPLKPLKREGFEVRLENAAAVALARLLGGLPRED